MNVEIWVATISFLGVFVSTIGLYLVKIYFERRKAFENSSFEHAIKSMQEILYCLAEAISQCECTRAMILYSSNGGGVPHGAANLYVTIAHEICIKQQLIKHKVQNIPVDRDWETV